MKKNNWKKTAAFFMAASALMTAMPFSASAEEKEPIKVGAILALGTATPFVAIEQGTLNQGDLQIEVSEFSDGSALMEAFAAGELDIAISGIIPIATWVSRGVEMKVVASANGGGHVLMTREETGITSVEELEGCMIAAPSLATVTDALLRAKILKDAGLDPEMDVTLIPGMKPADMATVLMATKEVDAMITWEPFASQAEAMYDDIVVLYDSPAVIKEETGSDAFYSVNVVAASQDFIDNRRDELDAFLDVYKQTIDFINTDDSANSVLAKVLNQDEETIVSARNRIDYTYEIDKESSMATLGWAKELGYIQELPAEEELFLE